LSSTAKASSQIVHTTNLSNATINQPNAIAQVVA
jgi:hypothetical protein